MRVLLLEPIHEDGVKLLQEVAEVVYATGHSEEEIAAQACRGAILRESDTS